MPTPPERRSSLAATITSALEDDIETGALRPLERIIELDVAARFAVSRAPVREALRALERDGLIVKGSQGYTVADVTFDELSDIFAIVGFLEELLTRRATPHVTESGLSQMRQALDAMAAVVEPNDVRGYHAADETFHGPIRAACPSRPLILIFESVSKRTLRFRKLAMAAPNHVTYSVGAHRKILGAIERGDAQEAGRQAAAATRQTFTRLARSLTYLRAAGS